MLKTINRYRKAIMMGLTRDVGTNKQAAGPVDKDKIKRILITRPNHRLGNMLLITPLVQEVHHTFPNAVIDLFVKGGVAFPIFEKYRYVGRIISLPKKHFKQLHKYIGSWISLKREKYDLVINVSARSSSGRLSTKAARATLKMYGDNNAMITQTDPEYRHLAKFPVYNFRDYLTDIGVKPNSGPVPVMSIKLSETEMEKGKAVIKALTGNNKPVISIFTNATGAKCYSEDMWGPTYKELLQRFPEYDVIEILPVENISRINFEAPHYYSKDIREIAAVMANSAVFIGADSGMMHLASAAGAPVIGLFSQTDPAIYGPYNNGSISVQSKTCPVGELFPSIEKVLKAP